MLKRIKLCEEWGLTRARIGQYVAQGMPLTSLEDADAWRIRNIPGAQKQTGGRSGGVESTLCASTLAENAQLAANGKQAAKVAWRSYKAAQKTGDSRQIATYGTAWEKAAMMKLRLDEQVLAYAIKAEILVPVSQAARKIATSLNPIRTQLSNWPIALSAKLNPAAPEVARKVIQAAVDDIYRQIDNILAGEDAGESH